MDISEFKILCEYQNQDQFIEVCTQEIVKEAASEQWRCQSTNGPNGPIVRETIESSDITFGVTTCVKIRNSSPAEYKTVCRMVKK